MLSRILSAATIGIEAKPIEMETKNITAVIDYRECNSNIPCILIDSGISVVIKNLKAGDYIINDEIAIERKTTRDFAQSIIDGRLFRQAENMKKAYELCLFIIEGNNLYNTSIDIHPHAVKGALMSLCSIWRIPVLFADDYRDTALLLKLIGTQNRSTCNELSYRPGRRPKRFRKRQLYILQGLPLVGPKLAVQLLDYFGTVERVITASEEKLRQIKGLGRIKAKKIRQIVSQEKIAASLLEIESSA